MRADFTGVKLLQRDTSRILRLFLKSIFPRLCDGDGARIFYYINQKRIKLNPEDSVLKKLRQRQKLKVQREIAHRLIQTVVHVHSATVRLF